MNNRRALLIGRDYPLMWALPQLLARSRFEVDVISSSRLMGKCKFVRHSQWISPDAPVVPILPKVLENRHYDWVIITEDSLLIEVAQSSLPLALKLKLLPVQSEKNFSHLYSKIGLSRLFAAEGVTTPNFVVVHTLEEALARANQIGYPLLVKMDSSSGGWGTFEIVNSSGFLSLNSELFQKPLLLQQKIPGIEWDLSALYLEGNLVHFSCARVEKKCSPFGVSSLRTYYSLSRVDEQVFQELAQIGKVLGAHGFVNIGCMEYEGRRFYFEADMRPNVWVEFSRFLGEDPALRIQEWFFHKKTLRYPVSSRWNQSVLLPYFLRLKRHEILFNRYKVWKFIPKDDPNLVLHLLKIRFFPIGIRGRLFAFIKWIVPQKYHGHLRRWKAILSKHVQECLPE